MANSKWAFGRVLERAPILRTRKTLHAGSEGVRQRGYPREIFEASDTLEIVAAARGGTENVDTEAAEDHDVTVLHAPGRNANAVSDYAVTYGLAAHRRIPYFTHTTDAGEWTLEFDPADLPHDVENLTVGIVGFGNIGRRVTQRYAGFGPELLAHDSYVEDATPCSRSLRSRPSPLVRIKEHPRWNRNHLGVHSEGQTHGV